MTKNESSDDMELKIADERVFHAEKSSGLPADGRRDRSDAALTSSSSVLCSAVPQETSKSPSVIDVGLNSSLNSSTAASDFLEQSGASSLMLSQGNIGMDYPLSWLGCLLFAGVFSLQLLLFALSFNFSLTCHDFPLNLAKIV